MKCERCNGQAGAHYAFCFIAQAWERFMGPGYPWSQPAPEPELETVPPDDGWEDFHFGAQADIDPEWAAFDPPDPDGVAADTAVAAGAPSDGDWMADAVEHWQERLNGAEAVRTDLPADYYDKLPPEPEDDGWSPDGWDRIDSPKPEPKPKVAERRRQGPVRYQAEQRQAREDAVVQYVYDRMEQVPGGRERFIDVHADFVEWAKQTGRTNVTSIQKGVLRPILEELGIVFEAGRLPGGRAAGKAPVLVCGYVLKREEAKPQLPTIEIPDPPKVRDKHPYIGAKPGSELPKDIRDLIEPLLTKEGWEYQPHNASGRGKPRLIAPDGKTVSLPNTPHLQGRSLNNTKTNLRKAGAAL